MKILHSNKVIYRSYGIVLTINTSVAGWRHALRSEWPFIIIIIMSYSICTYFVILGGNLFRASCVCTLKLFKHGDHGGSVHFAFWFVIRRKV